jgi:hypothetical protein
MTWPRNADGDVFRRLEDHGFDFSSVHEIDFNVDFEDWPPSPDTIQWLTDNFALVTLCEPSADLGGYVQFKIRSRLTYELVVNTQARVSAEMAKHGAVCESWGVPQEPLG